jgi:hypothetical protein
MNMPFTVPDAGNTGMKIAAMLKEIQILPGSLYRIVSRGRRTVI